jgi:hypothetical protein
VNAAGYCVAHDPEKPMDMRALGRKSGEARRKPNPERVHESLRTYLKREVPPERVWHALEAAMLGNNESARVSASRVLMDALAEERPDEDRKADRQRANAQALTRLAELLATHPDLQPGELAQKVEDEAVREHPDLVVGDLNPEQAGRVLEGLAARGLIVPGHRVDELVEERAQARLQALKAEHGITA